MPLTLTSFTNSCVSPLARSIRSGVKGRTSSSTLRTRASVRSRTPSTYSSPRSSKAAMVASEIMPRSATTQARVIPKRWRRRSRMGTSTLTSAVLPGIISVQIGRPSASTTGQDHLLQIGPMVLGVAVSSKCLAALALEGERSGVHEHDREIGEQVTLAGKQCLLDLILDGARREGRRVILALSGQLLPEPGHGAVEVMEGQASGARDGIVLHPRRAVAVRARDEEAVQGSDEHGPLEGELEGTRRQPLTKDVRDPKPLPQVPEQKRSADALAREAGGLLGIVQG